MKDEIRKELMGILFLGNCLENKKYDQGLIVVDALLLVIVKKIKDMSFEFMEPCEPDCDKIRHALHEGSWQHMTRMDEWANSIIEANAE